MRRIGLMALVLTLAAGGAAMADPAKQGVYIGAAVGQAYADIDTPSSFPDLSDDDFAYKIFAGYRAANFFAVEGGYRDFGSVEDGNGNDIITSETTCWDAAGVGILKISIFDIFAKVGIAYWDTDVRVNDSVIPDDGTNAMYGLGFGVRFGRVGVRAEYEYFDVKVPDDLATFTVGATFTF